VANPTSTQAIGNDVQRLGTVDQRAYDAADQDMWWGHGGNSPDNYNITDNASQGVEEGLKIHVRGGADILPTSTDADGTQHYAAPAGLDPSATLGNRAAWNFDYVALTTDKANSDHASINAQNTLGDFTFRITITRTGVGGAFLGSAAYDLDPASHRWVNEANPSSGFGGDDFAHTPPPALPSHLAENSVNLGFLTADFGPLSSSAAAGNSYDIQMSASRDSHLVAFVHDVVTLV